MHRPGLDITLPLATLHRACQRQPARTAALIADFVRSAEASMVPSAQETVSLARVLWCVRSRRYLESLARSEELLTQEVGGDIVAFIAESLPGQVMRGVPHAEWESAGIEVAAARRAADENTATRFARVMERIAAIERIPADGWRLAGDSLYQGSIVMVAALLRAFVERSGGDVLIGLPDRAVALVIPAALPAAETFGRRVLQEWREAMNPCSREGAPQLFGRRPSTRRARTPKHVSAALAERLAPARRRSGEAGNRRRRCVEHLGALLLTTRGDDRHRRQRSRADHPGGPDKKRTALRTVAARRPRPGSDGPPVEPITVILPSARRASPRRRVERALSRRARRPASADGGGPPRRPRGPPGCVAPARPPPDRIVALRVGLSPPREPAGPPS